MHPTPRARNATSRSKEITDSHLTSSSIGVGGKPKPTINEKSKNITSSEFLGYITSVVEKNRKDVADYASSINPVDFKSSRRPGNLFSSLFACLSPAPTLAIEDGKRCRDNIFYIANIHYNCDTIEHKRLIQVI